MTPVALKPPSMVIRATMDFFKHPYYKFNKTMMTLIGQWPDQSVFTSRICSTIVLYFYVSELVTRILTISKNYKTLDTVRDCIIEMMIQIGGIMLFIGFISVSQTTLKLLNRIRTDWQVWAREREVNILHEYTEFGKRINIAFGVLVYSCGLLVLMEPVIEKIIDICLKNGTAPGKFVLMVDYYHVDEQKYYFYVITYFNLASSVIGAPVLTNVIMLISYTVHGSGIFAALRHRLEGIGNDTPDETEKASCARDDRDMAQLAWCIDRHNDAIEYANLTNAAFTWTFFFGMGLAVTLVNGLGLLVLIKSNDRQVIITSLAIILFLGVYFLVICTASQVLIEHSISVRVYIYSSQWYRISPKAQKLLQCMMLRCNVPCQITAGNMLVMSMRTLWLTSKTTLSYFAFVRSTQVF